MDTEYASKIFDHLGIVSVICDEIEIATTLDNLIPPDPQMTITLGECLKLMIINGLGFTSRPLYLEAQFFESRPVQRFLGRDCASEINDDRLGRSLDRFYEFGCDRLFSILASKAAVRYGISQKFKHLDSTSMEVHGEYESEDENPLITFGYSKDHRPDLKQFMIYLMSSQDGDVPLLAQTVAGNSSDKKLFRENLKALKKQIEEGSGNYFVADSALYTEETIKEISSQMKWITRVPERIIEAKKLVISQEKMEEIEPGYLGREVKSMYGEIEQRWLLIYSEQAYLREEKTLKKQVIKEFEKKQAELKKLCAQEFDCEKDAEKNLNRWSKGLKYHHLAKIQINSRRVKNGKGRPRLNEVLVNKYQIVAEIEEDQKLVTQALLTKGRFIVASNELDQDKLSAKEMLSNYKEQQAVERGFRFLKDSSFMTSSVFLKTQSRIVALGMVMCLCLLCYTIAQRLFRKKLKELQASIPNQLGKPTQKPTMKWIFQLFEGVHVLIHNTLSGIKEIVLNLNKTRNQILGIFGPKFEKMYTAA
jgi:transposase